MSCQFLRLILVKIWLSLQGEGFIRALSSGAITTRYLFRNCHFQRPHHAIYSHHESSFLTSVFLSCERHVWVVWSGAWLRDIGDELFAVSLPLKMSSQEHRGQSHHGNGRSNEILVNCTDHSTLFDLLMSALKSLIHPLVIYIYIYMYFIDSGKESIFFRVAVMVWNLMTHGKELLFVCVII